MSRLSTQIFDSLGFLSPFIIQLRYYSNNCVLIRMTRIILKGANFGRMEQNQLVGDVKVLSIFPRYCISLTKVMVTYYLHAFCNASTWAYAAVVYLWCFYSGRTVELYLMTSKTHVASTKGQTIPLELLGAVILAHLMYSMHGVVQLLLRDVTVLYRTDSYTTLFWI